MELAGGKILAGVEDGVGRVVFNQPEKRNAMSVDMWAGMGEALDRFAADPAVRCVVLQGAGDKAFVSGADISQFEKNRADANAQAEYDRLTSAGRAKLAAYKQAGDRPDPRLLHGRGPRHRHGHRHPHRLGRQPVRHPGGQARHRLRLRHGARRWWTWSAPPTPT